ncbi:protein SPT2 homolog [Vanessa atalanta]|uniref:protein SPT2 homolog n=1 Tax=Vanessa atalanta TaxID=42275 RepID=UPI001FCD3DB3|nr:protein SPT2 homolog [Vanessa atalanta]
MEFRETLLAAQRNQQQKSSAESMYYKARFDPPKKELKPRDRLSANIQKFLAKKEEEERQKKLDAQKKRDELLAMRDPKALRKIQKTLKVIKSANKSVLADAIDTEHTAVTREGPDQPDQDDYGYESQEAAALYEKMMQKYSKVPDKPKFAPGTNNVSKDLNGTRERVKHALQHEEEPVPHKRRRRTDNDDGDLSPPQKYEPEKKKDEKPEKPKIRKPAPPPLDFNQLLKLAEQKKSVPIEVATKKLVTEPEPDRLMTKKQKREYEEEMARRQRRQERIDAEKAGGRKAPKEERTVEKTKRTEPSTFGRIPKLSDKNSNQKNDVPTKTYEREKDSEREKHDVLQREREKLRLQKEKLEREEKRLRDKEREILKAEKERNEREIKLNRDRLDKIKTKLENRPSDKYKSDKNVDRAKIGSREQEINKSIDLKSQNTYRIDKNSNEKEIKKTGLSQKSNDQKYMNGHSSQGKPVPKLNKEQSINRNDSRDRIALAKQKISESSSKLNGHARSEKRPEVTKGQPQKRPDEKRPPNAKLPGPSKPAMSNSFDFDKHVNSLGKNGTKQFPPSNVRRKPHPDDRKKPKRRMLDSDSEYDSEMDDFIDDGDENMDYSKHIKEIFGYDKSKYRHIDDEDDPMMESSFARQQREEYISKKIGIMEDLEDMRMEAMEKSKKKKSRRLSDD